MQISRFDSSGRTTQFYEVTALRGDERVVLFLQPTKGGSKTPIRLSMSASDLRALADQYADIEVTPAQAALDVVGGETTCERPGCLNAEHHDLSAGDRPA